MGDSESRAENEVLSAVALAESAVADRVFVTQGLELELPSTNVFGSRIAVEWLRDGAPLARKIGEAHAKGERVAIVARLAELIAMRTALAQIADARLGVVVHAIADGDGAVSAGYGPAMALADLPWGVLLGAGPGDALDLALAARRAAEDASFPFLVVHPRAWVRRYVLPVEPSREILEAFLGGTRFPPNHGNHGTSVGHAAGFGERVPFALSSAMRDLETLTGRRRDVFERAPRADSALALVGAGAVGDTLLAEVEGLRAIGHDVCALRLVAWRPFPAARLVKTLSRVLAMTVLEGPAPATSASAPLATHLKAAFADALTWAPDFPGIGCIPRIVSGFVAGHRALDSRDAQAIVGNMMRHELGKRSFVLGESTRDDLE